MTNIFHFQPCKTRQSPEYTLVLDLDETLVHCRQMSWNTCIGYSIIWLDLYSSHIKVYHRFQIPSSIFQLCFKVSNMKFTSRLDHISKNFFNKWHLFTKSLFSQLPKRYLDQWWMITELINQVYADKLISIIDPEKKLVRHRLFRENCVCVQGNYVKVRLGT